MTATGEDNQASVHPKKPTSYEDLVKCLRLDVMSEFNVTLSDSGALQWPVRFLYPEHNQSDVISAFEENTRYQLTLSNPISQCLHHVGQNV